MVDDASMSVGRLIINKPFRVMVCLVTLMAFISNIISYDLVWANELAVSDVKSHSDRGYRGDVKGADIGVEKRAEVKWGVKWGLTPDRGQSAVVSVPILPKDLGTVSESAVVSVPILLPKSLGTVSDSRSPASIIADENRDPRLRRRARSPAESNLTHGSASVIARSGSLTPATKQSQPIIIHIEDAHCNYDAQKKISEIIGYLVKTYGAQTVNLEGGSGRYDLSPLLSIRDARLRENVTDSLLSDGLIGAAEYYAANEPGSVRLWGVEDTGLYFSNLKIYRDFLSKKDLADSYIKSLGQALSAIKVKAYSPELLELELNISRYKSGKTDLKDYLRYLSALRSGAPDPAKYPALTALIKTIEDEPGVDFARADSQRQSLISALMRILSRRERDELGRKTALFVKGDITQKAFYSYLVYKASLLGLGQDSFPQLYRYVRYVSVYDDIDKAAVSKELELLTEGIAQGLCRSDEERRIRRFSQNLGLLKSLFSFSMSRQDYDSYAEGFGRAGLSDCARFIEERSGKYAIAYKLPSGAPDIALLAADAAKFYEYSFKRDEAFVRNISFAAGDGMRESEAGKRRITILVTGGFHTGNLSRLFNDAGMEYVAITPNFINKKGYKSPYFKVLSGTPGVTSLSAAVAVAAGKFSLAPPALACPAMSDAYKASTAPLPVKTIAAVDIIPDRIRQRMDILKESVNPADEKEYCVLGSDWIDVPEVREKIIGFARTGTPITRLYAIEALSGAAGNDEVRNALMNIIKPKELERISQASIEALAAEAGREDVAALLKEVLSTWTSREVSKTAALDVLCQFATPGSGLYSLFESVCGNDISFGIRLAIAGRIQDIDNSEYGIGETYLSDPEPQGRIHSYESNIRKLIRKLPSEEAKNMLLEIYKKVEFLRDNSDIATEIIKGLSRIINNDADVKRLMLEVLFSGNLSLSDAAFDALERVIQEKGILEAIMAQWEGTPGYVVPRIRMDTFLSALLRVMTNPIAQKKIETMRFDGTESILWARKAFLYGSVKEAWDASSRNPSCMESYQKYISFLHGISHREFQWYLSDLELGKRRLPGFAAAPAEPAAAQKTGEVITINESSGCVWLYRSLIIPDADGEGGTVYKILNDNETLRDMAVEERLLNAVNPYGRANADMVEMVIKEPSKLEYSGKTLNALRYHVDDIKSFASYPLGWKVRSAEELKAWADNAVKDLARLMREGYGYTGICGLYHDAASKRQYDLGWLPAGCIDNYKAVLRYANIRANGRIVDLNPAHAVSFGRKGASGAQFARVLRDQLFQLYLISAVVCRRNGIDAGGLKSVLEGISISACREYGLPEGSLDGWRESLPLSVETAAKEVLFAVAHPQRVADLGYDNGVFSAPGIVAMAETVSRFVCDSIPSSGVAAPTSVAKTPKASLKADGWISDAIREGHAACLDNIQEADIQSLSGLKPHELAETLLSGFKGALSPQAKENLARHLTSPPVKERLIKGLQNLQDIIKRDSPAVVLKRTVVLLDDSPDIKPIDDDLVLAHAGSARRAGLNDVNPTIYLSLTTLSAGVSNTAGMAALLQHESSDYTRGSHAWTSESERSLVDSLWEDARALGLLSTKAKDDLLYDASCGMPARYLAEYKDLKARSEGKNVGRRQLASDSYRMADLKYAVENLRAGAAKYGKKGFSVSEIAVNMRSLTGIVEDKDKISTVLRWLSKSAPVYGLNEEDLGIDKGARRGVRANKQAFYFGGCSFRMPVSLIDKIYVEGSTTREDTDPVKLVYIQNPDLNMTIRNVEGGFLAERICPGEAAPSSELVSRPDGSGEVLMDNFRIFMDFADSVNGIPSGYIQDADSVSPREKALRDWLVTNGEPSHPERGGNISLGNCHIAFPGHFRGNMAALSVYRDKGIYSRRLCVVDNNNPDNYFVLEILRDRGSDIIVSSRTGRQITVNPENGSCYIRNVPEFEKFEKTFVPQFETEELEPTILGPEHIVYGRGHFSFSHEVPLEKTVLSRKADGRQTRRSQDWMKRLSLKITRKDDGRVIEISRVPGSKTDFTVSGLTWKGTGKSVILRITDLHTMFNLSVIAELVRKTRVGDLIEADKTFLDTFVFKPLDAANGQASRVSTYRIDPANGTVTFSHLVKVDRLTDIEELDIAGGVSPTVASDSAQPGIIGPDNIVPPMMIGLVLAAMLPRIVEWSAAAVEIIESLLRASPDRAPAQRISDFPRIAKFLGSDLLANALLDRAPEEERSRILATYSFIEKTPGSGELSDEELAVLLPMVYDRTYKRSGRNAAWRLNGGIAAILALARQMLSEYDGSDFVRKAGLEAEIWWDLLPGWAKVGDKAKVIGERSRELQLSFLLGYQPDIYDNDIRPGYDGPYSSENYFRIYFEFRTRPLRSSRTAGYLISRMVKRYPFLKDIGYLKTHASVDTSGLGEKVYQSMSLIPSARRSIAMPILFLDTEDARWAEMKNGVKAWKVGQTTWFAAPVEIKARQVMRLETRTLGNKIPDGELTERSIRTAQILSSLLTAGFELRFASGLDEEKARYLERLDGIWRRYERRLMALSKIYGISHVNEEMGSDEAYAISANSDEGGVDFTFYPYGKIVEEHAEWGDRARRNNSEFGKRLRELVDGTIKDALAARRSVPAQEHSASGDKPFVDYYSAAAGFDTAILSAAGDMIRDTFEGRVRCDIGVLDEDGNVAAIADLADKDALKLLNIKPGDVIEISVYGKEKDKALNALDFLRIELYRPKEQDKEPGKASLLSKLWKDQAGSIFLPGGQIDDSQKSANDDMPSSIRKLLDDIKNRGGYELALYCEIGSSWLHIPQVRNTILDLARSGESYVRQAAIYAISAAAGEEDAGNLLINIAASQNEDPNVRESAIKALGAVTGEGKAKAVLMDMLTDYNYEKLQYYAIIGLRNLVSTHKDVKNAILDRMNYSQYPEVRRAASLVLSDAGLLGASGARPVARRISDEDPPKIAEIKALGRRIGEDEVRKDLMKLIDDKTEPTVIKEAAIYALTFAMEYKDVRDKIVSLPFARPLPRLARGMMCYDSIKDALEAYGRYPSQVEDYYDRIAFIHRVPHERFLWYLSGLEENNKRLPEFAIKAPAAAVSNEPSPSTEYVTEKPGSSWLNRSLVIPDAVGAGATIYKILNDDENRDDARTEARLFNAARPFGDAGARVTRIVIQGCSKDEYSAPDGVEALIYHVDSADDLSSYPLDWKVDDAETIKSWMRNAVNELACLAREGYGYMGICDLCHDVVTEKKYNLKATPVGCIDDYRSVFKYANIRRGGRIVDLSPVHAVAFGAEGPTEAVLIRAIRDQLFQLYLVSAVVCQENNITSPALKDILDATSSEACRAYGLPESKLEGWTGSLSLSTATTAREALFAISNPQRVADLGYDNGAFSAPGIIALAETVSRYIVENIPAGNSGPAADQGVPGGAIHGKHTSPERVVQGIVKSKKPLDDDQKRIVKAALRELTDKVCGAGISKEGRDRILAASGELLYDIDSNKMYTYSPNDGIITRKDFVLGCVLPDTKNIALIDGFFDDPILTKDTSYLQEALLHEILSILNEEKNHDDHKRRYSNPDGIQRKVFGRPNPLKEAIRDYLFWNAPLDHEMLEQMPERLYKDPSRATRPRFYEALTMLESGSPTIRFNAVRALNALIYADKTITQDGEVEKILAMLKDQDQNVRCAALETIPTILELDSAYATAGLLDLVISMADTSDDLQIKDLAMTVVGYLVAADRTLATSDRLESVVKIMANVLKMRPYLKGLKTVSDDDIVISALYAVQYFISADRKHLEKPGLKQKLEKALGVAYPELPSGELLRTYCLYSSVDQRGLSSGGMQVLKMWIHEQAGTGGGLTDEEIIRLAGQKVAPYLRYLEALSKDMPNMAGEISEAAGDPGNVRHKNAACLSEFFNQVMSPREMPRRAFDGNILYMRTLPASFPIMSLNLIMHRRHDLIGKNSKNSVTPLDSIESDYIFFNALLAMAHKELQSLNIDERLRWIAEAKIFLDMGSHAARKSRDKRTAEERALAAGYAELKEDIAGLLRSAYEPRRGRIFDAGDISAIVGDRPSEFYFKKHEGAVMLTDEMQSLMIELRRAIQAVSGMCESSTDIMKAFIKAAKDTHYRYHPMAKGVMGESISGPESLSQISVPPEMEVINKLYDDSLDTPAMIEACRVLAAIVDSDKAPTALAALKSIEKYSKGLLKKAAREAIAAIGKRVPGREVPKKPSGAIHGKFTQVKYIIRDIDRSKRSLDAWQKTSVKTALKGLAERVSDAAGLSVPEKSEITDVVKILITSVDNDGFFTYLEDDGIKSMEQFVLGCVLPDTKNIALIDGFFDDPILTKDTSYLQEALLHEILSILNEEKNHDDHKRRYSNPDGIQRKVFGRANPLKEAIRGYLFWNTPFNRQKLGEVPSRLFVEPSQATEKHLLAVVRTLGGANDYDTIAGAYKVVECFYASDKDAFTADVLEYLFEYVRSDNNIVKSFAMAVLPLFFRANRSLADRGNLKKMVDLLSRGSSSEQLKAAEAILAILEVERGLIAGDNIRSVLISLNERPTAAALRILSGIAEIDKTALLSAGLDVEKIIINALSSEDELIKAVAVSALPGLVHSYRSLSSMDTLEKIAQAVLPSIDSDDPGNRRAALESLINLAQHMISVNPELIKEPALVNIVSPAIYLLYGGWDGRRMASTFYAHSSVPQEGLSPGASQLLKTLIYAAMDPVLNPDFDEVVRTATQVWVPRLRYIEAVDTGLPAVGACVITGAGPEHGGGASNPGFRDFMAQTFYPGGSSGGIEATDKITLAVNIKPAGAHITILNLTACAELGLVDSSFFLMLIPADDGDGCDFFAQSIAAVSDTHMTGNIDYAGLGTVGANPLTMSILIKSGHALSKPQAQRTVEEAELVKAYESLQNNFSRILEREMNEKNLPAFSVSDADFITGKKPGKHYYSVGANEIRATNDSNILLKKLQRACEASPELSKNLFSAIVKGINRICDTYYKYHPVMEYNNDMRLWSPSSLGDIVIPTEKEIIGTIYGQYDDNYMSAEACGILGGISDSDEALKALNALLADSSNSPKLIKDAAREAIAAIGKRRSLRPVERFAVSGGGVGDEYRPVFDIYDPSDVRFALAYNAAASERFVYDREKGKALLDGKETKDRPAIKISELLEGFQSAQTAAYSYGNFMHNDWFVVYDGNSRKISCRAGEPKYERRYSMMVSWKNGSVSSEDVSFMAEGDKDIALVDGNNVSDKIDFAIFGQRLVRDGRAVSLDSEDGQLYNQFDDLYHLYLLPQFIEYKDGRSIYGEAIGYRELYEGMPSPGRKIDRQRLRDVIKNNGYMEIDVKGLLETHSADDIKNKALITRGYRQKDEGPLEEGDFRIEDSMLKVRLVRSKYPHNLVGITRSGKIIAVNLTGDKSKNIGYRVDELGEMIIKETERLGDPVRDVYLLANSRDVNKYVNGELVESESSANPYGVASALIVFVKGENRREYRGEDKGEGSRGIASADGEMKKGENKGEASRGIASANGEMKKGENKGEDKGAENAGFVEPTQFVESTELTSSTELVESAELGSSTKLVESTELGSSTKLVESTELTSSTELAEPATFADGMRELSGDLRREAVNIFIMRSAPQSKSAQADIGKKTGDMLKNGFGYGGRSEPDDRLNIGTRIEYFEDDKALAEKLETALASALSAENSVYKHKIFVDCLTQEDLDTVNRFIAQKKTRGAGGIESIIAAGRDFTEGQAVRTLPDEARVIMVGTVLLNDRRMKEELIKNPIFNQEEYSSGPGRLLESRRMILDFLRKNKMIPDEDVPDEKIDGLFEELWKGLRALSITKVNWEKVEEFKIAQEALLRSL